MNTQLGTGAAAESREALSYVPLPSAGRPVSAPAVQPRFATRRWVLVGIATLLLATSLGIWWSFSGNAPVGYETAPVAIGDIARDINATGSVNPELTIIVGTYVSGVIQELMMRLQYRGQARTDLRQDRSPPVSEHRRSSEGQSRYREGATGKGQGIAHLCQGQPGTPRHSRQDKRRVRRRLRQREERVRSGSGTNHI